MVIGRCWSCPNGPSSILELCGHWSRHHEVELSLLDVLRLVSREEISLRLDVSQGPNLDIFFCVSELLLLILSLVCRVLDVAAKVLRQGGKDL